MSIFTTNVVQTIYILSLAAIGFETAAGQSVYSLKGKVVSYDDGLPIAGASVQIVHSTIGTATGIDGTFRINGIPAERKLLTVSAIGFAHYRTEISDRDTQMLSILLEPSLIQSEIVVVTANKRPQSLQEVPVSISIIDAHDIEKRNITAVDDALRYIPGVNFQQTQINIRASSGYSRGVGSRVMMLMDGIPLLAGDTGEITFESIPISQIERVEVVKGAGSALYGSGAMGGVINVLMKEIGDEPVVWWRTYAGVYSNPEYDQWKWSSKERYLNGQMIGISGGIEQLKMSFSLQRVFDDGYREQDWSRKYDGFLKLKYDLSPYESITFTSNLYWQYRGDFLWWKDLKNALRPADAQRNVSITSLRFNNSFFYKKIVNEKLYYEVKAVHFRGNWYRDSLNHTRMDGSISDSFVLDAQGNVTADDENTLTFGIVGNGERVRSNIFGRHNGRGGAFYLQNEYRAAKDLSFTVGLRHDLQQVVGLALNQQTSPKLGIRYSFNNEHTIRASAGRGFRSPSIGELYTSTRNTGSSAIVIPSTSLRPEQSWSFEISSSNIISENLTLETALFNNEFNDLIEPNVQGDTVLKAVTVNFTNITQARIRGGEVSVLTNWFEHSLTFEVHYNYNWAVDSRTGSFLRFRPRHIAGMNSEFRFKIISVGADYRYVSRIEAIDDKLVELAPIKNGSQRVSIHIADARIAADFTDAGLPFRTSVVVNNIFGYNYNELIGNVSPPRQFMLTLEGMIH